MIPTKTKKLSKSWSLKLKHSQTESYVQLQQEILYMPHGCETFIWVLLIKRNLWKPENEIKQLIITVLIVISSYAFLNSFLLFYIYPYLRKTKNLIRVMSDSQLAVWVSTARFTHTIFITSVSFHYAAAAGNHFMYFLDWEKKFMLSLHFVLFL